jgi:hypothetical protein
MKVMFPELFIQCSSMTVPSNSQESKIIQSAPDCSNVMGRENCGMMSESREQTLQTPLVAIRVFEGKMLAHRRIAVPAHFTRPINEHQLSQLQAKAKGR